MSMSTKKKTALGAGAAIAAAAVALGAGTFAFFSSTGEANSTDATAGTLQLGESATGDFTFSDIAPDFAGQNSLTYTNDGSLAGTLVFDVNVTGTDTACTGDEQAHDPDGAGCAPNSELPGLLDVEVTDSSSNVVYSGPVSDLTLPNDPLAAGGSETYTFDFAFPDGGASDNAAQGDTATVTVTATLQQPA